MKIQFVLFNIWFAFTKSKQVDNNANIGYHYKLKQDPLGGPNVCYPESENPCCDGWIQEFRHGPCVKPLCNPPCKGGVCIRPNMCQCRDGTSARQCPDFRRPQRHGRTCRIYPNGMTYGCNMLEIMNSRQQNPAQHDQETTPCSRQSCHTSEFQANKQERNINNYRPSRPTRNEKDIQTNSRQYILNGYRSTQDLQNDAGVDSNKQHTNLDRSGFSKYQTGGQYGIENIRHDSNYQKTQNIVRQGNNNYNDLTHRGRNVDPTYDITYERESSSNVGSRSLDKSVDRFTSYLNSYRRGRVSAKLRRVVNPYELLGNGENSYRKETDNKHIITDGDNNDLDVNNYGERNDYEKPERKDDSTLLLSSGSNSRGDSMNRKEYSTRHRYNVRNRHRSQINGRRHGLTSDFSRKFHHERSDPITGRNEFGIEIRPRPRTNDNISPSMLSTSDNKKYKSINKGAENEESVDITMTGQYENNILGRRNYLSNVNDNGNSQRQSYVHDGHIVNPYDTMRSNTVREDVRRHNDRPTGTLSSTGRAHYRNDVKVSYSNGRDQNVRPISIGSAHNEHALHPRRLGYNKPSYLVNINGANSYDMMHNVFPCRGSKCYFGPEPRINVAAPIHKEMCGGTVCGAPHNSRLIQILSTPCIDLPCNTNRKPPHNYNSNSRIPCVMPFCDIRNPIYNRNTITEESTGCLNGNCGTNCNNGNGCGRVVPSCQGRNGCLPQQMVPNCGGGSCNQEDNIIIEDNPCSEGQIFVEDPNGFKTCQDMEEFFEKNA